jgi:aryl-alcohol dehydrogenase
MKATVAVTSAKGSPFALQEVDLGELAPDEVLVRVAASGICHTDLICRDQWYPVPLPQVLGHEGAGVVEAVGSAVTKVARGDRVGMTFDSCGTCPTCAQGRPSYCHLFFEHNFASPRFFGQSSFATHSVARERNVVRIDSGIPLEVAAPFGCGIQTGAGAVLNSLRVPAGSALAVFGSGTVGLSAVLAAVVAGCTTIVAVDVVPARLDAARELGATHTVDARETDAVEAIRLVAGPGVDFALETTGNAQVLRQCVDCLAPTGTAGVIGAPAFGTEVSLDVNTILTGGRVVRGIVEGDSVPDVFLPRLVKLWEQGRFPVERLMTFYDFDDIEQAARDAETGQTIKAVLRMA